MQAILQERQICPFEQLAGARLVCALIRLAGMGRPAAPVLASHEVTSQLTANT